MITGFNFWGLISNITLLGGIFFQILGFMLGIVFLCLMILARFNLGSSWRVGLDYNTKDELVTTGFYKFIRNPYFEFMLGLQLSTILLVPNVIMILAFIQSYLLLNIQIMEEETFLNEKYGEEYILYKKNIGRFIPKL